MKNKDKIFFIFIVTVLFFLSCGSEGKNLSYKSSGSITRVNFDGPETTIIFDNLSDNNIFLVKVNTSSSIIPGQNTGGVRSIINNINENDDTLSLLPDYPPFDFPIRGRPEGEELLFPHNTNDSISGTLKFQSFSSFIPFGVTPTRDFYVESSYGSRDFHLRSATLLATSKYCNIWVIENSITTEKAQQLADKFDEIYPHATNIIGYEFGGGPGGNGGVDGDLKIQILVYNIINNGPGEIAGYFWGKDHNNFGVQSSNQAEMFYMNAVHVNSPNINTPASTLIHEFQHMVNFNRKYLKGYRPQTWYNEMLSMMLEDILADKIGIPPLNNTNISSYSGHVMYWLIMEFIFDYYKEGVTEWGISGAPASAISYATKYAFGAYLLRNYGGAELLKRIMDNNLANEASITTALSGSVTFNEVLSRFGEVLVFSGNSMPAGVNSFDKTVTNNINGIYYTSHGIDIYSFSAYLLPSGIRITPFILSANSSHPAMRPNSINVFSNDDWRNKSGNFSITLNRPVNQNAAFFLMVK